MSQDPIPEDSRSLLYSFRRCPYAMRARMALRYAGIRCELREVILRDKPEAMLNVSQKGTVPVLVIRPGTAEQEVIDESLDIMLWALAQNDPDGWLAADPAETNQLILASDDDFKVWLDRYKYPDRYAAEELAGSNPRDECCRFLDVLESRLAAQPWLVAGSLTLADVAIFPFVRQFAHTDIDWFRGGVYPAVCAWMDVLLESEFFTSVMAKYPAWAPGDEVTVL
ncbi:MAG: glutathione S-transferase [Gammaproteobacteria bacterium]|nr:glutathione S-transferase [Gammaproteobacteria bacterium]